MGLLDRISLLVRSNVTDAIDRAEDPEKAIKQLLLDMNSQIIQVKTQVAAAIADEKRLQARAEEAQRLNLCQFCGAPYAAPDAVQCGVCGAPRSQGTAAG